MSPEQCKNALNAIVEKLDTVMSPAGFTFKSDSTGVASGGPFSSGFYSNKKVSIGLIYRSQGLGCIIYEVNRESVSHDDVMRLLGHTDKYRLHYDDDRMMSTTTEETNVINALLYDLSRFLLPAISDPSIDFSGLVQVAGANRMKKLFGN